MLLRDEYIHDVNIRLSFYKRIASAKDHAELDELRTELIDRFGTLPDAGKFLLSTAGIRLQAQKLGMKRIEAHEKGGFIEFNERNKVDPMFLISLLQNQPKTFRMEGPVRLKFFHDLSDRATRLAFIKQLVADFDEHQLAS